MLAASGRPRTAANSGGLLPVRWLLMNWLHRWICSSEPWKRSLETSLLPWALGDVELGRNVLELGPGPGGATDALCRRCDRLTAIEIDSRLVEALAGRLYGSNVHIVRGDASLMPFADGVFSGAVSLTMLHHVPSPALQDRLLREVRRVLAPGGAFVGVDSLGSRAMQILHWGDTFVPVDPAGFGVRLEAAGFGSIAIEVKERRFRFRARRA